MSGVGEWEDLGVVEEQVGAQRSEFVGIFGEMRWVLGACLGLRMVWEGIEGPCDLVRSMRDPLQCRGLNEVENSGLLTHCFGKDPQQCWGLSEVENPGWARVCWFTVGVSRAIIAVWAK